MRFENEDGKPIEGGAWVIVTPAEALQLLEALSVWCEESPPDPGWHHHLTRGEPTVTLAIEAAAEPDT